MGGSVVRLCELGPLEFEVGGERVPVRGRRATIVLARLSVASPVGCSRADLVDAIWDVDSPPTAPQSLANTIAHIRRTVGTNAIETTGEGYRLGDRVVSDRREFLRRSAAADREYLVAPSDALVEIEAAKRLWRGEPYSGSVDSDWTIEADRHRLHRAYEELRRVESVALSAAGRHNDAIALASEILATDPIDEETWITLINSLREIGQPMRALQAARRALSSVREEGLTPSASLRGMERDLIQSSTRQVVELAGPVERSGWQMLADCVDHWNAGRTAEAVAGLEDLTDVIDADDRRRFARAFAGSDPGDGWARGRWTEVVGLADHVSGRAERVLISLDANALERDPAGLSIADAEVASAPDQRSLVRSLRVRFMAGCAHPLDDAQRLTVERLAVVPDDEAAIEAPRFESVIAAKEGNWEECLAALDRYESRVSDLRPDWGDDFAALSRAVLQLSGVWSGQPAGSRYHLLPMMGNVRTISVVHVWRQLNDGGVLPADMASRVATVGGTLPQDTAAAFALLAAIASHPVDSDAVDELLVETTEKIEMTGRHRYWQLAPVVVAKTAIRRRDRDLVRQMFSTLEPWSGEQLGLWPLDLVIGSADELLDELAAL